MKFKRSAAGQGTFCGSFLGSMESFGKKQVLEFGCGKKLRFSVQEIEPKEEKSEEKSDFATQRARPVAQVFMPFPCVCVCVCVCETHPHRSVVRIVPLYDVRLVFLVSMMSSTTGL